MDGRVYHIYKRNLFMLESVEHSKFRSNNEKIELKNNVHEQKIIIFFLVQKLTLEELYNVLDNLEEHPSNKNFYSIWKNVLCITKEEFDDISKELSFYIEDYLPKYEYPCYNHFRYVKDTLNFYNLVKDGVSIDEMKYYVYYFIKYDDSLKIDLYNKHKYIFTERVENTQRLYILTKFKCM
ncbi:hypothetical protein PFMG_01697 [Plasmodium falciparum IGH-CR14]|uniref:Plasmodium RESA N-terminal domain-containing protein n=1 Tax=Plasmodium falciparum IGH-CR14 TaxID=580059 RepID=A0A0L1I782_PLAFA|nr:hypothetical protein PFMG_01697 [Plasmodium falciparum IGH-CR14]